MIEANLGKQKGNMKKCGKRMGMALSNVLKIDPLGPLASLFAQLEVIQPQPQHIAERMRNESQRGNGRFYDKSSRWWGKRRKRIQWFDSIFYVTKDEDLLLGWMRRRRCDPYQLFILLSEEDLELFFAKMYGWKYLPTDQIFDGLTSKQVIAHLEW